MVVEITHVHMSGGASHEHIADVRWITTVSRESGESSRAQMVEWLQRADEKKAVVSDGRRNVYVGVVKAHPPYIRTYADGVWTDNLLALPRY